MKEYFLVRKSIDGLRINGEWQDVSLEAAREAAKIDVAKVDAYLTREEAEQAALDGVDLDNDTDTDFFPVLRIEVPNRLKGSASEVELNDGSIINTKTFKAKDVTVTDAYLSHLDASYDDISLKNKSTKQTAKPAEEKAAVVEAPAASATVAASRLSSLRRFVPAASLNNAKNVLGLGALGAAYYFGNGAVVDLVAKTGYALPEMVATNPGLPVGAGIAVRLVTETPQLLFKGIKNLLTGLGNLCKAGKAKWDARKAPKVTTEPNAGSAKISQLAAVLEQPEDSADMSISNVSLQTAAFKNQQKNSAALRELIPQKAAASTAEPTKLTVH